MASASLARGFSSDLRPNVSPGSKSLRRNLPPSVTRKGCASSPAFLMSCFVFIIVSTASLPNAPSQSNRFYADFGFRGVWLSFRSCLQIFDLVGFGVVGGVPFLQQTEANGQQRRPEENADETEGQLAAEHTKENQEKRQVASLADEPGFDDVINAADAHAPDEHEEAPAVGTLVEQPKRRRHPDQGRTHRHDGKEEREQRKQAGTWHARNGEACSGHACLHQRGAQDAIDYTTNRVARHGREVHAVFAADAFNRCGQAFGGGYGIAKQEERDENA